MKIVLRSCIASLGIAVAQAASAISPVNEVFRIDDRNLQEIRSAGGMWPRSEWRPDDDLLHHFEGESVEGGTSNFVSTTSELRTAVTHAASLARPNSEMPFDEDFVTYLYRLRPADTFFGVDDALRRARDASPPNSSRRTRLTRLLDDYGGMHEYVARGGLVSSWIIAYARLDASMLRTYYREHGSAMFRPEFWTNRWIPNSDYDRSFDSDVAATQTYSLVGDPSGHLLGVVNGDQPAVALAFTCLGVNSMLNQLRRDSSRAFGTCKKQHLSIRVLYYATRRGRPPVKETALRDAFHNADAAMRSPFRRR